MVIVRIVRYAEAFATRAFGWIFGGGVVGGAAATSDTLKIVYAYSAALSLPRTAVTDEAELPYPKPRIKVALIDAMGRATQESMRQELRNAYLRLADWQPRADVASSVGETEWRARVDAEIRELNDELRSRQL